MADGNKVIAEARVVEVTLMEDRARVVRRGVATLAAGTTILRVEGVSPLISDKTLVGRVISGEEARVVATSVRREHHEAAELVSGDPERIQRDLETIARQVSALGEANDQARHDLAALDGLEQKALEEMAYDVSWAVANPAEWERDLDAIRERAGSIQATMEVRAGELADLKKRRRELERQLAASSSATGENVYCVEALVQAAAAGDYSIEFEYVVPSACWRPSHMATLSQNAGVTIEWRAEGCVWQNTGEEWRGVQLFFSTQRPSLGLEPPELGEDLLEVRKKPEQIVVEVREQTIQDAGPGQADGARGGKDEMPGIDDGGETLNLQSASPADIPSDGRPYRVEMFTFQTQCDDVLVCMPELVPAVILKTAQANTSTRPLLAGPVDLVRQSGKVGNTTVSYVAPGESFDLGWGPDPELRVQRWVESGDLDSRTLSSWEETRTTTHITLSNIGSESRTLELHERIPVSEIDAVAVKFDPDVTSGKVQPDDNGFLRWEVTLDPFGRDSYTHAFVLRKKKAVSGV